MCATCGCSTHVEPHDHPHGDDHEDPHVHDHEDAHGVADAHARDGQGASATRLLRLEHDVLARNDRLAASNRAWLTERGVLALNLVSSPGAGKTTLLERTVRDLGREVEIRVIEGDQATSRDAERIRAAGGRAVQITTGTVCHLDAAMVARVLPELAPPPGSILIVENVGNLVCPALFDLGEHAKVIVSSVPEGDDKPLKYPHMFRAAGLVLLNKMDLLSATPFDRARCLADIREVNPALSVIELSATRGDGLDRWYAWLRARLNALTERRRTA